MEGSNGVDPEQLQARALLSPVIPVGDPTISQQQQPSDQASGPPESSEKTLAAKVRSSSPACPPSPRVSLGRAGALQSHPCEIHDHIQQEVGPPWKLRLQALLAAGMGLILGLGTTILHAMLHGPKNKGMDNSSYNKHTLTFKKETVLKKSKLSENQSRYPPFLLGRERRETCITLSNISCLCAEILCFPRL